MDGKYWKHATDAIGVSLSQNYSEVLQIFAQTQPSVPNLPIVSSCGQDHMFVNGLADILPHLFKNKTYNYGKAIGFSLGMGLLSKTKIVVSLLPSPLWHLFLRNKSGFELNSVRILQISPDTYTLIRTQA